MQIANKTYDTDALWTNVTPKINSYIGRNIYLQRHHPISIVRQQIVDYFYKSFTNAKGNPLFSVFDALHPVVGVQQNFDQLLIPGDHVSRAKADCYYVNRQQLLRAHMTAHQVDLLQSGLDNFLMVGDVYRRDEIDATHFPVFHQLDAVRTVNRQQLFKSNDELEIFETRYKTNPDSFSPVRSSLKCIDQTKQPCHTLEAVKLMEHELKRVLLGLVQHFFGEQVEYRWVDTYFPFTQPSWELEIRHRGEWLEVLGSGIMRHEILANSGVKNSIGWAFGVGLERLTMVLYDIPDIRLFWSRDSGFLRQFREEEFGQKRKYQAVSAYPQCSNDMSFWLDDADAFAANDFYDAVREVAGDVVEQVTLRDRFVHPKTGRTSLCFRIVYRHMERTLTQAEVNELHVEIEEVVKRTFGVEMR